LNGKIDERRAKKPNTILIFGENDNDCHALKNLVEALRPSLARIETRRRPIILSKDAHVSKRDDTCREIAKLVAAQNVVCEVVSVIAHRDCDAVEPAHEPNRDSLLADMRGLALPRPVAATPAFEMEAWWFLWPQALAATRACWSTVRPHGNVGRIVDAKEKLRRELRPKSGDAKCPDYTESDSRKIAENVRLLGIAGHPQGKSDSFADFVNQLRKVVV
jgi:hypothetical protein